MSSRMARAREEKLGYRMSERPHVDGLGVSCPGAPKGVELIRDALGLDLGVGAFHRDPWNRS